MNGHCFNINGIERFFCGGLLVWTGDTWLGINYVSGFKEGVGRALRFCRHCMATREESNNKVKYVKHNNLTFNNVWVYLFTGLQYVTDSIILLKSTSNSICRDTVSGKITQRYFYFCISVHLPSHRRICSCIEDPDNAKNVREQLTTTYSME